MLSNWTSASFLFVCFELLFKNMADITTLCLCSANNAGMLGKKRRSKNCLNFKTQLFKTFSHRRKQDQKILLPNGSIYKFLYWDINIYNLSHVELPCMFCLYTKQISLKQDMKLLFLFYQNYNMKEIVSNLTFSVFKWQLISIVQNVLFLY